MAATATRESFFHSALDPDVVLCRHMQGKEEISRPFEYWVELLVRSSGDPLTPEQLLGKNVCVELQDVDSQSRFFNGWISHFRRGGVRGRYSAYHVELRPWLWYLSQSNDCRIFQNKTAVEIIDDIFGKYSSKQVDKRLSGTYRKRAFCVQYRESDLQFVSRLMEDEGIYYFFEHTQLQHVMVLCDSPSAHKPIRNNTLTWSEGADASGKKDSDIVTSWSRVHSIRSLKYTHTDFDPESPSTSLLATAQRTPAWPKPSDLEVYDHPGEYDDLAQTGNTGAKQQEGERLAKLRVSAWEAQHDMVTADSPCRGLATGNSFKLDGHDDAGEWLVIASECEFTFGSFEATGAKEKVEHWGFRNEVRLVSKSVPYLPISSSPRPLIAGPQTATVVGPAGDELHTDKYGRVKVQFHWDRVGTNDEKSSCFVRVSFPWAGKQFGMVALPRIGDEVVVEFLEGNPDRPLVTGRVYNGDNLPPYTLPDHATVSGIKTRSSKGGVATDANELRFDDATGSEYIWFQAQKDFHQLVKNDSFASVQNNLWTDVTKDTAHQVGQNLTVKVGKQAIVDIGADTHATLGTDLNLDVGGAMGVKVAEAIAVKGGDAIAITSGSGLDVKVGAGLNMTATSAVNIKGLGVVIDGGTTLCIKAGGAFITLGPEGVTIQGTMVKINSGGSAGSADSAADASPTKPKKPDDPTANKDPLASS